MLKKYDYICGYQDEIHIDDNRYVRMYLENSEIRLYSIKGRLSDNEYFWIQTEGLTNARKLLKKTISLLKKTETTIEQLTILENV
jgi:hypothetical protein